VTQVSYKFNLDAPCFNLPKCLIEEIEAGVEFFIFENYFNLRRDPILLNDFRGNWDRRILPKNILA